MNLNFLEWFLTHHQNLNTIYIARTEEERVYMGEWCKSHKEKWLSKLYVIKYPPEEWICGFRGNAIFIDDLRRFPEGFLEQNLIYLVALNLPSPKSLVEKVAFEQYSFYDCKAFLYDIDTNKFYP